MMIRFSFDVMCLSLSGKLCCMTTVHRTYWDSRVQEIACMRFCIFSDICHAIGYTHDRRNHAMNEDGTAVSFSETREILDAASSPSYRTQMHSACQRALINQRIMQMLCGLTGASIHVDHAKVGTAIRQKPEGHWLHP